MRARITPDDLAAGKLVEPSWYPCEIVKYEEVEANTDKSTNCLVHFKVLQGGKENEFKGARCRVLYNEKAMAFAAPLLIALGAKVDKDKGVDADLSESTLVGRKLDVHIRRGTTNKNNSFNEPIEFAPLGTVTKFKEPVTA